MNNCAMENFDKEAREIMERQKLLDKGKGYHITHPNNDYLRSLIEMRALKRFKEYYSRFDKRLSKKGFRSYKFTYDGCYVHIETTYKNGCKYGQTYDVNMFIN